MRGAAGDRSWLALAAHPMVALLLGCEIASFALWLGILAKVPLSEAFPVSGVSYILVIAASHVLFHEPLSPPQLIGSAAIMAGAWLVGSGAPPEDR